MKTQYPSRFSEATTQKAARAILREASFQSPVLPNGCSRLWANLSRTLVEGKANAKGSVYVVNIFDRSAPWISPRYSKCYVNSDLRVVTADAVCFIEDRLQELHAMSDDVSRAIVSVQPFTAKTHS